MSSDTKTNIIFPIVFYIILLIFLLFLTWYISEINGKSNCVFDPDIQCYKDWSCEKACPVETKGISSCYSTNYNNNLSSCLFNPLEEKCEGIEDCSCQNTERVNCMQGCPISSSGVNSNLCKAS